MVGSYRLGAGSFVLNSVNVVGQIDKHPAADRLLLNLIRHARVLRAARSVGLPADFDGQAIAELYPPETSS